MLTEDDYIKIPYTKDLTQAGVTYACRHISQIYRREESTLKVSMCSIVADIAVGLAFRRYLTAEAIPHTSLATQSFTTPDLFDVIIWRRRCRLINQLVTHKGTIRKIRKNPAVLNEVPAVTPIEWAIMDNVLEQDLYVFTFVNALVTSDRVEMSRAIEANQPVYPIYPFPIKWIQPPVWFPLGEVVLQSEASHEITLELAGHDIDRNFATRLVNVNPGEITRLKCEFCAIHYLHGDLIPDGRLKVYSSKLDRSVVIHPYSWVNLWVYGMDIFLAGYIPRREYEYLADNLPLGSRIIGSIRTNSVLKALPVGNLYPMSKLFSRKEY
jgi:hypothetical protein